MCPEAKDRKFAREFVFPSQVHGMFQRGFQILFHPGASDLILPSHQRENETRMPRKLTTLRWDDRTTITWWNRKSSGRQCLAPSWPCGAKCLFSGTNTQFSLYSRVILPGAARSIHLLPPHEHVSSTSLTGYSLGGRIHTRFAWLGHGTIMHRELSESFLSLIGDLNFTGEERNMADNYFTILRNDFAEIWYDQGVDLGGGQPFTVGTEGEKRNRMHIVGAHDSVVRLSLPSWLQGKALSYLDEFLASSRDHPYVLNNIQDDLPLDPVHAVCLKRPCLLSASLAWSSSHYARQVRVAKDLLPMALNSSLAVELLNHALSRAVDADPKTFFESKQGRSTDAAWYSC